MAYASGTNYIYLQSIAIYSQESPVSSNTNQSITIRPDQPTVTSGWVDNNRM